MLERTLMTSMALMIVLTIAMLLAALVHVDLGALAIFAGIPLVLLGSLGSWLWERRTRADQSA